MVKLIWRSDVHVSDNPPVSRTDDWNETLMGKLTQVGEIAREVGAAAVLDGGDFFHVKSPGRNAHRTIQRVAQVHNGYPCPVYGNIGNHDCKYGDYEHLPEQPLGVLFETGVFKRCYDEHEVYIYWRNNNAAVTGEGQPIPWGPPKVDYSTTFPVSHLEGTPVVRVVGIPYHGTEYDWDRFTCIKKGDEDYLVVMAHVLASKEGGSMFEGEDIIQYAALKDLDPDVWCFGHWHKNQGVTEIAKGKWVVNIGSLSRGALSQDEVARIPAVAVLKFDALGVEIEQRPLKVAPPEEVFDLVGRTRREAKDMTMGAFVDSIKETLSEDARKPVEDTIRDMSLPSEVKERALLKWEEQG
jgi:DNA repair exonuclease SbcCD nuclease subunit